MGMWLMNVTAFLDDIERFINAAPLVERNEWDRQAIRRLEAAHLLLRLQAETIEALTERQTA